MSNTEDMSTIYSYDPIPYLQFRNIIDRADELLRAHKDINLTFPVNIDEINRIASWDYLSTRPEDRDDDEGDNSYPFHNIYIGLYVTTAQSFGYGNRRPYLITYIGAHDMDKAIELFNYALDEGSNMEKITNDIAAAAVTIRELETLIANMSPERIEIAQNLLNRLLDR